MACAGCKSVFYCGAECQANAWSDNKSGDGGVAHKDECHLLAEVLEIGARLSAAGASSLGADALLLIGKPVKRGASTSPEKDDTRETKKAAVATATATADDPATDQQQQQQQSRETDLRKVMYPLTRDVLRLISLMTLLDAASLMRASPAWRVLYEQIDWKAVIISQWDNPTRTQAFLVDSDRPVTVKEGVKSIGRWIADNSIYRLYPELASAVAASDMPEYEVLMSDLKRQEVLVEQEAERAQADENEEEYDRKLNQLIDLSAREGEIKYQFLLRSFQSIVSSGVVEARRALMNICIAYRMYEHNVAVDQIYALRKAQSGARPDDDDEDHDDNGAGPFPFFAIETLSKDIRGFFWRPIYREKWEEMGPPPKNLAELSVYSRRLATRIDGINIPKMDIVAKNVRNFPRALTLCAQVITGVEVGRCPQWSDTSFRNLSKMDRLEEIKVNGPLWSKANVDFYATCPRLKTVSILRAPHGMAFSVSPAVMRESIPGSGLFGACSPNPGQIQRFTFFNKESEILNEYTFERFAPRKLPPGPYAGLTRRAHIESVIRRAFLSYTDERPIRERRLFIDDNVLVETLLAELTAKKLFEAPDPKSEKEYEKLVETFCAILEKTGVSPVEAEQNLEDTGNIALPFRVWFNRGLEYILDGEPSKSGRARTTTKKAKQKQQQQQGPSVIPSHARDACRISAERRRQVGAYPSLEELAEAMVAWRASVYNMAIAASRTRNGRVEYCKWVASKYVKDEKDAWRIFFRGERVDNREKSRDNATKYTWTLEPPNFAYMGGSPNVLVVPHELVMAFVFHSARVMREGLKRRRYSVASFRRFFGDLPAWLWLADAAWSTLKLSLHFAPYVPPQLMYHPGLRTFYCDNSTGWGTPGNEVQWDLIDLAPEARPLDAPAAPGTKMHQYHHDFEGFIIEDAKQLKMSCFPPIRTQGYIDVFGIDFE